MCFLLGFSFVRTVLRLLFGSHPSKSESRSRPQRSQKRPEQHRKIFNKNDGEYVDYEEVND
jgi:hypothetical protein